MLLVAGVVLAVAAAAWRILHFPFEPERLRACLPPEALLLGEHDGLDARWETLIDEPVVRHALREGGASPESVRAFLGENVTGRLIRRLAGRRVCTAYVPALPGGGGPAWVAAGWGGPWAQVLRGLLQAGLVQGFRPLPGDRPVGCWSLDTGDGTSLSLVAAEGVALLCWSADPSAARRLWQQGDYRRGGTEPWPEQAAADRFVFGWPRPGLADADGRLALDVPATNRLGARLEWRAGAPLPAIRRWAGRGALVGLVPGVRLPAPPAEGLPPAAGTLPDALLGRGPAALLTAPLPALDGWLSEGAVTGEAWGAVRGLLSGEGLAFAALLRGAFAGRVLGMPVPVLMVGAPAKPGADVAGAAPALLDALNRHGARVLGEPTVVAGQPAVSINSARQGLMGSLPVAERPILAMVGGWLVFSSNARALQRLVDGEALDVTPPWREAVVEPGSAARLWADIPAAGAELRTVVGLAALVMLSQQRDGSRALHSGLLAAGGWLGALAPYAGLDARLGMRDDWWILDLRMGPAPDAEEEDGHGTL